MDCFKNQDVGTHRGVQCRNPEIKFIVLIASRALQCDFLLSNQMQGGPGLLLHYPEGGLKVKVSQGNQSEMFPLF